MPSPNPSRSISILAVGLAGLSSPLLADDATVPFPLPPLEVVGETPSLTQPSEEETGEALRDVAGGTNLVPLDTGERRLSTLEDALAFQPGVMVQSFFGGNDQPRLNIRGSGIQSNPQARGVRLLRDGLPLNHADGSYVIGALEPRVADHMAVYRGANAIRHGGNALGGAVNLIAPTGRQQNGGRLDLSAGSYGHRLLQLGYGMAGETTDAHITAIGTRRDGFRDYNESERDVLSVNVGWRHTPAVESRFYLDHTDLAFDVSGPLNRAQLRDDPQQVNAGIQPPPPGPTTGTISVGPHVQRDRPWRAADFSRIAWRLAAHGENTGIQLGVQAMASDDVFGSPTQVRASETEDLALTIAGSLADPDRVHQLDLGMNLLDGDMDRRYRANERGQPGRLFADNRLQASDHTAWLHYRLAASDSVSLETAVQYLLATRNIDEAFADPNNRPRYNARSDSYSTFSAAPVNQDREYTGTNVRLGLLYRHDGPLESFINLSQGEEPPTFLELLSTTGGTPDVGPNNVGAAPLDSQSATTLELGSRGRTARMDWQLSLYHSELEDELLTSEAFFGGVGITSNYEAETTRTGLEAGLDWTVLENLTGGRDELHFRTSYEFSEFRFDGGAFDGKQIAGIPRHRIQAALAYTHPLGLSITPSVLWQPSDTPTDHANTIHQPDFAVFNLTVAWQPLDADWSVFLDARNLADRHYASSYLIRERVPNPGPPNAGPEQVTTFLPGEGRSFYLGFQLPW